MLMCILLIPTYSRATEFTTFSEKGISLKTPTGCRILGEEEIQSVRKEAKASVPKIPYTSFTSTVLLSMRCGDNGLGANLRLSYKKDKNTYTGINHKLETLSSQERRELENETKNVFINTMPSALSVSNVYVRILNREPRTGILISYNRTGNWSVFIYNFYDEQNQRKVLLTLSYHTPEKGKFEPIFEKVVNSLQF